MTTSDILYDIIHLPLRFNEAGDKSIHAILAGMKYSELRCQITVEAIRNSLSRHPECVTDWLRYSEDKRSTGGWYFKEARSGEFIVGCLAEDDRKAASQQFYDDKIVACAVFVKRELDSIMQNDCQHSST